MKTKIFTLFFIFIFDLSIQAKEWELKDHPILEFKEKIYDIKLKAIKFWQGDYDKTSQSITISYILEIKQEIPESILYVRIQDEDGFEITSKRIDRVVKNYIGTLKGTFNITPEVYKKIKQVEIFATTCD